MKKEQLKKTISLIKQDGISKKIVSIKSIPSETIFSSIDSASEVLVDCDLDSVLSIGKYELADLRLISFEEGISFPGLLPVVTVDSNNKVLMQAFLNREALSETFRTGFANYFSRSRNKIWLKGESSDNKQELTNVYFQEKNLYFVYVVNQKIAACHEGFYSCFYRKLNLDGSFLQIDFDRKFKPEKVYG